MPPTSTAPLSSGVSGLLPAAIVVRKADLCWRGHRVLSLAAAGVSVLASMPGAWRSRGTSG